jgi:hypothetical protein
VLAPFEEVTREVSSEAARISLVIPLAAVLRNLVTKEGNDAGIKTIKSSLLESLNERFNNSEQEPLYTVATLVDPRFKKKNFSSLVSTTAKASVLLAYNAVTQTMLSSSQRASQSQQPTTTNEGNNEMPAAKQPRRLEKSSRLWDCMDEIVQSTSTTSEQEEPAKGIDNEMTQYLCEPVIHHMVDPLLWWRQNVERFPNLATVTRAYLGAPPTSVPSERLFSLAGEVLSDHRSSLRPDNAARLIFLKYNSKLIKEN